MKLLSYLIGVCLGLLIVAPPIGYNIPMFVNSFHWCYLMVAAGMFGMFLMSQSLHWSIKALVVYLFGACFFSQAPYLSFNAYALVVASVYAYLLFQKVEKKIIYNILEAAFLLQLVIVSMQLLGKDTLLNFDRPEKVFLGTVMQYMRLSSLLAVLSPFLILRSKWYIIPIGILCILSKSSGFAVSLLVGTFLYLVLTHRRYFPLIASLCLIAFIGYAMYDFGSFQGAIDPRCGGRMSSWYATFITWFTDTSKSTVAPFLYGTFNWKWFFFGHGMDTYLPLFPVYKHDYNPFPQAHNCWLQFLWEIGLVGFGLISYYCTRVAIRLYVRRQYLVLAGMACLATNMFFAFPTRMTQTALLLVCYLALSERVTSASSI